MASMLRVSVITLSFSPLPLPSSSLLFLSKSIYHPYPNPFLLHQNPLLITTNTKKPFNTSVSSSSTKKQRRGTTIDVDEEEEDDWEDDDDVDGEEDFNVFDKMRRWEQNKPSGFGEGKVYDTTVEEKLLEEIEKTRMMAQLAAHKKSKEEEEKEDKKQQLHYKTLDTIRGPCVRLGNLPKKKNIHRDLQRAFKGFPGIGKISPSVSGNQKTRDPICKGFAFIEFQSEEAANRFVKTYSKQNILFGKVQKQISCDVMNPGELAHDTPKLNQANFTALKDESHQEQFIGMATVEAKEESTVLGNSTSDWSSDSEGRESFIEHLNISPSNDADDITEVNRENTGLNDSMVPTQIQKKPSKKKAVKTKKAKSSKSTLLSSMSRLKIKERSVLTDVFSKYGGKVASLSD